MKLQRRVNDTALELKLQALHDYLVKYDFSKLVFSMFVMCKLSLASVSDLQG